MIKECHAIESGGAQVTFGLHENLIFNIHVSQRFTPHRLLTNAPREGMFLLDAVLYGREAVLRTPLDAFLASQRRFLTDWPENRHSIHYDPRCQAMNDRGQQCLHEADHLSSDRPHEYEKVTAPDWAPSPKEEGGLALDGFTLERGDVICVYARYLGFSPAPHYNGQPFFFSMAVLGHIVP